MKKTILALAAAGAALNAQAEVVDIDSKDCSFYLENVSIVKQSKYGFRSESILFDVKLPDYASELGMYVRYSDGDKEYEETNYVAKPDWNHHKPFTYVTFYTEMGGASQDNYFRTILDFAFFYEVKTGDGATERYWFKNDWQNFTGQHLYDGDYAYTAPQMYGYGTRRYLRHDSGSPLFHRLNSCR